jgi:hypothetical protein
MHDLLTRLAGDVERALEGNLLALILGGGYGRGEGGVVVVNNLEKPYNDLDLVLILNSRSDPCSKLDPIRKLYEEEAEIEIDFSRPATLPQVRKWNNTLMWKDLYHGHVVLKGPKDILVKNVPSQIHAPLPAIEATRLLLNRGAGLLWALRVLKGVEKPPDSDFIRRNYFKCALALGDAVLISHGRFQTAYTGRGSVLTELASERKDVAALELLGLYSEALKFKFSPSQVSSCPLLLEDVQRIGDLFLEVLLHVERRRTPRDFPTISSYTDWRGLREESEHTVGKWPRNLVRNLQEGVFSLRYPRERLYRQLPGLLELEDGSERWEDQSELFLKTWRHFN